MHKDKRIGMIIISYKHDEHVKLLIDDLRAQMKVGDKISLVNNFNGSDLSNLEVDYYFALDNPGYATAANTAAKPLLPAVDIILAISPGSRVSENLLTVMREGANGKDCAAWMPLIVLDNGTVNSAGNIVHISGLSWCDGYTRNIEVYKDVRSLNNISGACMAFSVDWWTRIGGVPDGYFMYYEDPEMSARVRMLGGQITLLPKAQVEHIYKENGADDGKKRYFLERNRHLFIIRNWPLGVIVVLSPILVMSELGLWMVAIREGKFTTKVMATIAMVKSMSWALRGRREFSPSKIMRTHEYLAMLHPDVDSPILKSINTPFINRFFRRYHNFAMVATRMLMRNS